MPRPDGLRVRPISIRDAQQFVLGLHRHHKPSRGAKFAISVVDGDGRVRGVSMVGRPVARALDNGVVAEVTRLCTDGARNACSMLYGASWRVAREMGYDAIVTYVLAEESGTSLRAAGWVRAADVPGRSWDRESRPRDDVNPTGDKVRWECRRAAA